LVWLKVAPNGWTSLASKSQLKIDESNGGGDHLTDMLCMAIDQLTCSRQYADFQSNLFMKNSVVGCW
jgi:hypothetical protein